MKVVPPFVKVHGFISKSTAEGKSKFNDLIGQSQFVILPTKADCTPIVFVKHAFSVCLSLLLIPAVYPPL